MSIRFGLAMCLAFACLLGSGGTGLAGELPERPGMGQDTPATAPADEGPRPVKIIADKDIITLHDDTTIEGTVLFTGQKAVIIHTADGERTIPREQILRIQNRRTAGLRKAYETEETDGHVVLTNKEADPAAFKRKKPAKPERRAAPVQELDESIVAPEPDARQRAIQKALDAFRDNPEVMRQLMKSGGLKEGDVPPEIRRGLDRRLEDARKKK